MKYFIGNETDQVPKVKAPISQAVVADRHCYISGQLSTDLEGNYVPGSVVEEAERAFSNLFAVAKAAGFEPSDLVFIDLAFIDLADVALINPLFTAFFESGKMPARTIYQAAVLPYGGKIKVTAVGLK